MKKLLLFFAAMLVAGSMWGETYVFGNWTSKPVTGRDTLTLTGTLKDNQQKNWTYTLTGSDNSKNPSQSVYTNSTYWQLGANGNRVTAVFSTSNISGTITKIEVECAAYNNLGDVCVTVGGSDFDDQNQTMAKWNGDSKYTGNRGGVLSFEGSATGEIVVTMSSLSRGRAIYLSSITVTTASESGEDGGEDGGEETTLYSVNIVENITNGEVSANPTQAAEGATVTLSYSNVTEHYHFEEWTVLDGNADEVTVHESNGVYTFTMPGSDVEVEASFAEDAKYNAIFSINGATTNTSYYSGQEIIFPEKPADIFGKTFVGWYSATYSNATAAPSYVTSATMGTEAMTFYAVFATATEGGTDVWTKITSASDITEGTYSLITYDGLYYLPNANATSAPSLGEVTETNGVIDVKANMKWNLTGNNTDGYVFESAATSSIYLWGAPTNDGIRIGNKSAKANPVKLWFVENNSTYGLVVYNNSDSQKRYLATYGNSNWRNYGSISDSQRAANLYKLVPGTSYSEYSTTVASSTSITISAAAYSTYFNSKVAYVMPDDCEGYVFTSANGLSKVYDAKATVPAGEPLVIYTIDPGTKTLVFTTSTEDTWKDNDMNDLEGTDVETTLTADDNYYFYGLSLAKPEEGQTADPTTVGFYWMAEGGAAFTNGAHKAYLKLAKSLFNNNGNSAPRRYLFNQTDTATDVESVEAETAVKFFENGQLLIKKNGVVYNAMGQVVR